MPELPDHLLITQALHGDQLAFRMLVEKHARFCHSLAYRMLRNANDAEDVAQEAFIRLWKNLEKYRPEVKVTTWLYTIITNLCLDQLKSSHARNQRQTDRLEIENGAASTFMPEAEFMQAELTALIIRIADELKPKQKAVYVLREMESLSVAEIGVILSMSPGNVKSNLYYARLRVSERLKMYYQERKPLPK